MNLYRERAHKYANLKREGYSVQEIADMYHMSRYGVYYLLRKYIPKPDPFETGEEDFDLKLREL